MRNEAAHRYRRVSHPATLTISPYALPPGRHAAAPRVPRRSGLLAVLMLGGAVAMLLGCYLLSLRVSSARAEVEAVDRQIAVVRQDSVRLGDEYMIRSRFPELERWGGALRLSAPQSHQYLRSTADLETRPRP